MKILYLTNIPSPYRVDFFNELGKLCDLTVLFERSDATDRNDQWFEKKPKNFNSILLKGLKIKSDSAINLGVLKYLNKKKYDIIVLGGYATPTGMLAINYLKLMKLPFILNADGGFINEHENFIKRKIKKYYISAADYWLSTGQHTTNYLKYYGARQDKIFVYPFTSIYADDLLKCPTSYQEKQSLKKELGIHSEKVVISVGQFIHRKGMDALINAWGMIKDQHNKELIIIGEGELKQFYQEKIIEKELSNIRIISFQKKQDLVKYYKASDLMTLMTREDIWGLVINEALAHGLPVITTDKCIAGLELIKDNENGFIIPVDNIELASKNIEFLINNENKLYEFAKDSLGKTEKYTIENMALKHFEFFCEIMR